MRETGPRTEDSLPATAMLYACGELDETEAADFERRLADDQSAREALCQAVELNQELAGLGRLAPNPAYRDRVRASLRRQPTLWSRVMQPRSYRGHPALWAVAGAAAALLIMLSLPALPARPTANSIEPSPLAGPAPAPDAPVDVDPGDAESEVAVVWSEMPRGDHLSRAIGDGNRRRLRLEDRRPSRSDQRMSRFLTPIRMMN